MKIVCVGGGPAGLYFAILVKLRNKEHDIIVLERRSAGRTYGWGIVFGEDLLDNLYNNDLESAQEIYASSVWCDAEQVHIRGKEVAHLGGYTHAIGRKHLLDILAKRAMDLGAHVQFERKVEDLSEFGSADLIVASDGVNSRVRQLYANHFQTNVEVGRNKYIWLGTHKVFDTFTYAFEETGAGWIWFHGYPFNSDTSTCVVECSPETWKGLGFDECGPDESLALLEDIFEPYLDNHSLINLVNDHSKMPWLSFKHISNQDWYHGNVVLMGDAAHTTHFTIGSGTKLALEDAIELAGRLSEYEDLQAALEAYKEERCAAMLALQIAARNSAQWFENIQHYINQDAVQFAYSLSLAWRHEGKTIHEKVSWRYQRYLATQKIAALRRLRRWVNSARRDLRARKRG